MRAAKYGLLIGFLGASLLTACGDDDSNMNTPDSGSMPDSGDPSSIVDVEADISADETWTADKTYIIKNNVFVRNATLTIEEGTVIKGDPNSSLVITSSAMIDAVGSAAAPIVFTSSQPEGSQAAGDWGGVVLLGKAPMNVAGGTDTIEGFAAGTDGTEYGGNDATHNCGTLKYVRIEFAGFELSTDNELNSLTLGACGSDTTLEYLQLHKGNDDGVEFFGGTASMRHVLVTQVDDDGLDWDYGWTGKVQFLIVQQNGVVGNNAIEADSNGNDNDATPRSNPELWNITFVGSNAEPGEAGKFQQGIHFRRGTAATVKNMLLVHFADSPINVDGASSVVQAEAGDLTVSNSLFFDNANSTDWPIESGDTDDDEGFDEDAFFKDAEFANLFVDPLLEDATNLTAPSFMLQDGSPALAAGATPGAGFDTSATYIGAMGQTDWTAGWTAFP